MTRRWALALSASSVLLATACEEDFVDRVGVDGTDAFQNYVAIGTSISMGVQSSGVYYAGQTNAWPALVADAAFADFEIPLIEAPGCGAPLIAPLQFFRRLDASSAASANAVCAENMTGVTLPANNLAIDGATTYQALRITPADVAATRPVYSRVLPGDQSQVEAMTSLDPTFVTVELGANEVLRAAAGGILLPATGYNEATGALGDFAPGVPGTFAPFAVWSPVYDEVIDAVVATGARAMLVTVPQVASIVSLRRGAELYADRAALQARGVVLNADCAPGGAGENNLVFVPLKIVNALGAAAATGTPQAVSCANVTNAQDNVLSVTEQAQLTAVVQAMNDHIAARAAEHGFALFDGNEVLGFIVANKPAFSAARLVSCSYGFGQFISLDGVHPNTNGHRLIAFGGFVPGDGDNRVDGATDIINQHYGFDLEQHDVEVLDATTLCN